ncbi:MAG: LacI family DNA-binding transcriptional regulator [Hyphomicrobiaceae bacterium]
MAVDDTVKHASIRQVATRAGCSLSTVSRVINRSGPVSASAIARVEAAISDLAFRPNALGQSMRKQRSRAIGAVVPSFTNPVFAASVAGIEAVAREVGRPVLLSSTGYDASREVEVVETLLSQKVDGIALTVADASSSAALDRLDRAGVPYVLLYNQPRRGRRPAVTVDNFAATAELTRHLIGLGHTRIAYLGGRFGTTDRSRVRFEGCTAALTAAGLQPPALLELDYMGSIEDHATVIARALPRLGNPTALLCSNDLLAISVIAALRALGLSVPRDVSVAGFDGIAIGQMLSPGLATIDTPTVAMGERAMRRLLDLLSGAAPARDAVELLPYEFRPGGTLASVPDGNASGRERRRRLSRT